LRTPASILWFSTFTLCTIPGVVAAIQGILRVLKPGSKLIFFEHGLSPDPTVRPWQERSEPIFRRAFEGCHVTRDIPSLIGKGGFNIEQIDAGYLTPFPKSGSYCWWGVAHPELRKQDSRYCGKETFVNLPVSYLRSHG
jgi:hypothetical protein